MKLLLDVHIGLRLAKALRASGYDVVRAAEAHYDWSDENLLALACADQRVIVTEDGDFTDLVFVQRRTPPISILYLRADAKDLPSLMDAVLEVLTLGRYRHHIVVITPLGIRYRPFPGMSNDYG